MIKSYISSSARIGGWFFLSLSLISACAAAWFWMDRASRQTEGTKAPAIVTAVKKSADVYCAYFTFTTTDGKEMTTRSQIGSNPPSYAVGDKEEVIYPAGEPGEAVENIFIAHYIIPLALTAETLFMGLFGLILLCVFRKTKG